MSFEVLAGSGLGLLVGLLLGLSSSHVVSLVIAALATGMVTLLGFTRDARVDQTSHSVGSAVRLGCFGIACAAAVLLGLAIRTHDWLSPSLHDQIKRVHEAGYTLDQAREWVATRNLGSGFSLVDSTKSSSADTDSQNTSNPPVASSVLFSDQLSGQCQYFNTAQYKNPGEELKALRLVGGTYAAYAKKIEKLNAQQQQTVVDGLHLLFCAQ